MTFLRTASFTCEIVLFSLSLAQNPAKAYVRDRDRLRGGFFTKIADHVFDEDGAFSNFAFCIELVSKRSALRVRPKEGVCLTNFNVNSIRALQDELRLRRHLACRV